MNLPTRDLDRFFRPDGIAIIGSVPSGVTADQLRSRYERFGSRFFLVNPRGGSVDDLPIYRSVTEIPERVELAVIQVGARHVTRSIEECGKKGVLFALIFSAGFSEVGDAGRKLEEELGAEARRHGIRVFGPNTNYNAFEPIADPPRPRGGRIGLITQSGHNGRPIVQGVESGVAFTRWIPTGNELDLEAADFIEYFADDPATSVIAGYIEGFKSIPALRRALTSAADREKPVVMLKIGRTEAGARMATSHTGHLTGSDQAIDGLFHQHGVSRVSDLDELLDTSMLFAKLPPNTGPGCCLYSISGGSGTLMTEIASDLGIQVPTLSTETRERLHRILPGYLTVGNPVDNGGAFLMTAAPERRQEVLDIIAEDPSVDVIVAGLTGALPITDNFAADLVTWAEKSSTPVVVTWNSPKTDTEGFRTLVNAGLPVFRSFRNCFGALRAFQERNARRHRFGARPSLARPLTERQRSALARDGVLPTTAVAELLADAEITVVSEGLATSRAEATELVGRFGTAALKISSPDIPHRSDLGLVRLGVDDPNVAAQVFDEFVATARDQVPDAMVDGVSVQRMVTDGVEMIVGVTWKPGVGHSLLVGAGGIYAEVLGDVAVRPLPVDETDVREMIDSLRVRTLLAGARGRPPADIDALVGLVLKVAVLAESAGPRLDELDLNPVLVSPDEAIAVDALVVGSGASL